MKIITLLAAVSACSLLQAETVHYVTLKFSQVSYTLNLWQHVKDAGNAFSITIPTTKRFYDSVAVGQELDGKFKAASFVISGHLGKRRVTVENKFIREERDEK